MGSGDRQQQIRRRFNQGKPIDNQTSKNQCNRPKCHLRVLGNHHILTSDQGYLLLLNGQEIGKYREIINIDENKAIFKLDKGMLLEVTPIGTRKTFSNAKARIHAIIASEGSLYHNPEKHIYEIKVVCKTSELIDIFREDFKDVYNQELHFSIERGKYNKARISSKDSFNDLISYGARKGNGMWRIPIERLDHEGAREWLKMFIAGDGSVGYEQGKARVRFFSKNQEGLKQLQKLLNDEFRIKSELSMRDRTNKVRYSSLEYILEIKSDEDTMRYIIEIGSYSKRHQNNIAKALGG